MHRVARSRLILMYDEAGPLVVSQYKRYTRYRAGVIRVTIHIGACNARLACHERGN